MKKFFLAIFVLLILAVVLVPRFARFDALLAHMASNLCQRLQRKVVIGRLELVPFPPGLRLHEVAILAPSPAGGGDVPLLRSDEISIPLQWTALLQAKILPQALHFRGWNATVHRQA